MALLTERYAAQIAGMAITLCGRLGRQAQVLAGPIEGTALGNSLAQAMGQGEVGSLAQARQDRACLGPADALCTLKRPSGCATS